MADSETSTINSQSSILSSIPHPSTIPSFTPSGSSPHSNSTATSTPSTPQRSRTDSLDYALRKIFIGGLSYSTDEEKLRRYFKAYGPVQDAVVMKDPVSKRSRGFGFITYFDVASVENALANEPHTIDMRRVEAKRAVPRSEINRESFSGVNPNQSLLPNYYSNMSSDSGDNSNYNSMNLSLSGTAQPGPINRTQSSPIVKSWKGLVQNQPLSQGGYNQPSGQGESYSISPSYEKLSASQLANSPAANASSNIDSSKNGYSLNLPSFQSSSDEYAYNKIFVGGLHYDTRDPDFRQYFEKYGKVISAEVMFNRETHKSRGFGFIIFESEESAIRVCNEKIHYIAEKQVEVKRAIPRSKIGMGAQSSSYQTNLINSASVSDSSPSSSSPSSSSPSSPHTTSANHHSHSPNSNSRSDVRRSMSVSSIGMGSLSGNSSTLAASSSIKLPNSQSQTGSSRKIPSFHPTSPSEISTQPSSTSDVSIESSTSNSSTIKPTSYIAILKSNTSTSPVSSPSLGPITPSSIPSLEDYSNFQFLKDNNMSSFSISGVSGKEGSSHAIPTPPTPLAMNSLPSSTVPSISSFLSSEGLASDSLLHNDNWYPSMYENNFFFSNNNPPQEEDLNNSRPNRAQSEPAISIQKGWQSELGFLGNAGFDGFPPHIHQSGSSGSLNNITESQGDALSNWLRNSNTTGDVFPSNSSISGSSIHSSPLSVTGTDLNNSLTGLSLPPSIMNNSGSSVSSGQTPLVPSFESWHNLVSSNSTGSDNTSLDQQLNFDPSVSRIFQEINLNSSSIDESASKFLSMTRGSRANSELSSNSDLSRGEGNNNSNSSNSLLNFGFSGFNGLVGVSGTGASTNNSGNVAGGASSSSSSSLGLGSSFNELRFDSKEFDPNGSKPWTPSTDYRFNP